MWRLTFLLRTQLSDYGFDSLSAVTKGWNDTHKYAKIYHKDGAKQCFETWNSDIENMFEQNHLEEYYTSLNVFWYPDVQYRAAQSGLLYEGWHTHDGEEDDVVESLAYS